MNYFDYICCISQIKVFLILQQTFFVSQKHFSQLIDQIKLLLQYLKGDPSKMLTMNLEILNTRRWSDSVMLQEPYGSQKLMTAEWFKLQNLCTPKGHLNGFFYSPDTDADSRKSRTSDIGSLEKQDQSVKQSHGIGESIYDVWSVLDVFGFGPFQERFFNMGLVVLFLIVSGLQKNICSRI